MVHVYCSSSCAAKENNKKRKVIRYCLNCKEEIKTTGKKYCSHTCHQEYQYKEYIRKWKNGEVDGISGKNGTSTYIRKYIFDKFNDKCTKCGWSEMNKKTGKIPLNLEHIDGNWKNNKEENLDLLCPNCHSLTETYGILNKGNGRENRY